VARSSNDSKNSKSSDVSPLKAGALLEFAPGIALIPFDTADIVIRGLGGTGGAFGGKGVFGTVGMRVWT